VITGRGCEITGPARTQVSLEFSDGRTARLTAGKGSLKSALRPRYARRVTYLPYE
jgi:hypothetical protein